MDDVNAIALETASRLFRDNVDHRLLSQAETGVFPTDLWKAVEEAGLTHAMIPEAVGGFGLDAIVAVNLIRLMAFHSVPLPLAETMLAARFLAEAGIEVPSGPMSVASASVEKSLTLTCKDGHWHLAGEAKRVPWGRCVKAIVIVAEWQNESYVAVATTQDSAVHYGCNLAQEPRDDLKFDLIIPDERVAKSTVGPDELKLIGAAVRSLAIAGALDRVLEMTASYVGERVQFGRTLSKFQAIQQSIAVLAGQVAAAGAAADLAAESLSDTLNVMRIAVAKIRAGEAAGISAGIAHQLHGAMGFSFEYSLHFYTKRLWSWRDEYGGEAEWSRVLGAEVLRRDADELWPFITVA